MKFLFIHQNFPGQFRHVARALGNESTHEVVAIGEAENLKQPHAYAALRQAARQTVQQRFDLRRQCLPQWLSLLTGTTLG